MAKSLINQAAGVEQLDFHVDEELQHLTRSADGAEFSEGLNAFFGKRFALFDGGGWRPGASGANARDPEGVGPVSAHGAWGISHDLGRFIAITVAVTERAPERVSALPDGLEFG